MANPGHGAESGGRGIFIKASNGLDLRELRKEGLLGPGTPQIMMQFGMEAFTNPEVISNSVAYIGRHGLFTNEFLKDLSMVDIGLLRGLGLLPLVNRILRPATDGVAIQRMNAYTYRTADYQLSTAQRYHPGEYGDQQHIWSAVLDKDLTVFTTHPAKALSQKGALSGSPGYWVGNGRNPDAAQEGNVLLAIYDARGKKGFGEKSVQAFTHAYFPWDKFDGAVIEGNLACGRRGEAYIALIGGSKLAYAPDSREDLIQEGGLTWWIAELGSKSEDGSFEAFMARISSRTATFDPESRSLEYSSKGKNYELHYTGEFLVDGLPVATAYPRFDSPYSKAPRKPTEITIEAGGRALILDFYGWMKTEE